MTAPILAAHQHCEERTRMKTIAATIRAVETNNATRPIRVQVDYDLPGGSDHDLTLVQVWSLMGDLAALAARLPTPDLLRAAE